MILSKPRWVLTFFLFLAVGIFVLKPFAGQKLAKAAEPSLSFEPASKEIATWEIFEANIIIDTAGQEVAGAGAIIIYDPNIISVVEIVPGEIFSDYPSASFDNVSGRANLSGIVGSSQDLYSGSGIFGKIKFQGKSSGQSEIRFDYTPGSTSDSNIAVTYRPGDILASVGSLKTTVTSEMVSPLITAPPTSAQIPEDESLLDKIKAFLGLTSKEKEIDPFGPLPSQEPRRNPSSIQESRQKSNNPIYLTAAIAIIVLVGLYILLRRIRASKRQESKPTIIHDIPGNTPK